MSWYPDLAHDQADGHGDNRPLTQMAVIHCTDNTAGDEAEAHYAEHRADGTSAHFYSDDDSVTQAVDTDEVAYGCFPIGNSRSVQFELTGLSNHVSDAAMRRVAPIVARACAQYGIPIRHVGPAELAAGAKGICGHGDVTRAWGEGDHTDPGDAFPWATFIGYVAGSDLSGDDMSAATEKQINDFMQGIPDVEPVKWRQRDEAWQAATSSSIERILYGMAALINDAPVVSGSEWKGVPNALHVSIAALKAPAGGGLTDAQVAALGDRVAAALVAHPGNSLTGADAPVIVAAVKQALAEGVR